MEDSITHGPSASNADIHARRGSEQLQQGSGETFSIAIVGYDDRQES
jgi:hypothetical protein